MKLKTLKDFPVFCNEMRVGITENSVSIKDLRQEAIKWIKFNIKAKEKNLKLMDKIGNRPVENMVAQNEGAICWIKHFFNISEEELK